MTQEERIEKFPPGSRWWWVERHGGEVVHLSLVQVVGHVSWAPDVFVRSVRSGRRYGAGEDDLLPLSAFADPSDTCATCGRPREHHNVRHIFRPSGKARPS